MKIYILLFFFAAITSASYADGNVVLDAKTLQLSLDHTGRFASLRNTAIKKELLAEGVDTFLLMLKRYSEDEFKSPKSLTVVDRAGNRITVDLKFDVQTSLRLKIAEEDGWFSFRVIAGQGVEDIDRIHWGPYNTNIFSAVGEFFGLLYSDDVTLGLMSLSPNTDASETDEHSLSQCAFWLPYPQKGSFLLLECADYTRKRNFMPYRTSDTDPELTVIDSAVALYGCPGGKELDQIEKVVLKERLPYPAYQGRWSKRSKKILAPSIWCWFNQSSVDEVMELCGEVGASTICAFISMFGNWGHFDPAPELYPGGMNAIRAIGQKCREKQLRFTMYTLTNFIKPKTSVPEPFITPKVDPRFERYDISTELSKALNETVTEVSIQSNEDIAKLVSFKDKVILIDNELISFTDSVVQDDMIILKNCKRGLLLSTIEAHDKNSLVEFMYFAGYENLFPGTMDMSKEVAVNIANKAREGLFAKVTLDGLESCLQTGCGYYAMNQTLKTVYDMNKDREMVYTSSQITNYGWHILSYISWGEHDRHKGFRGTMLDYRIRRQLQLQYSLMPKKMGQHYPGNATLEDINWLMGVAAGWDSGVEFSMTPSEFQKNPQHEQIAAAVKMWEKARCSGMITDAQKLRLRQVDRVHTIAPKADGSWDVKLLKRWRHSDVKILPSSVIQLKHIDGEDAPKPCGIDISWTHSPLVFKAAAISDDIVLTSGRSNRWSVIYPGEVVADINGKQLQFVLRVSEESSSGIKNPVFSVDNSQHFMVPVAIQPGQYIASPLNVPLISLYNKNHEIIKEIPICYSNDLCSILDRNQFNVNCEFEPVDEAKTSSAVLNLLYSEIILKKKN